MHRPEAPSVTSSIVSPSLEVVGPLAEEARRVDAVCDLLGGSGGWMDTTERPCPVAGRLGEGEGTFSSTAKFVGLLGTQQLIYTYMFVDIYVSSYKSDTCSL